MVEKIEHEGITFAIVLRKDLRTDGINFFSSADMSLQLGNLKHRQGSKVKPHIHKPINRAIYNVQEVLHVEYGLVECNFYNGNGEKVKNTIIR